MDRRAALRLLEEPLVAMDGAMASLGPEASLALCRTLLHRARRVDGAPAFLVHNSDCPPEIQESMYVAIRDALDG